MEYICHRMNRREELKKVPEGCGVEIDLRDGPDGKIYLEHNPFSQGEDFEEYIKAYAGKGFGTMILNVKSERIEHHALELMEKYRIEDFFFLDSTFPMVKLLSDTGENRIALRYSDWEGLDTLHHMKGKVGWAWVDCFDKFPWIPFSGSEPVYKLINKGKKHTILIIRRKAYHQSYLDSQNPKHKKKKRASFFSRLFPNDPLHGISSQTPT